MNTNTSEAVRRGVFEKIGRIVQAISSPARLKIIQMLAQSPRTVEELSELSGESVANTSQHLQKLLREGLVKVQKDGLRRIYSISNNHLLSLWETVQNLSTEISPEISAAEDELTDLSLKSEMDLRDVLENVRKKKAILIDVRDEKEATATPVASSIVIPLHQLEKRKRELKKNVPIIVFCRGRFCSLATKAVQKLRAQGYDAYRLRESAFTINRTLEIQ